MASYLRQVFSTAFARWAPRTDLWGGVFGALVPCAYVLAGQPVPDNVTTLIAEIAVCTAGGLIALRLLIAPYLIWKSDQATIAFLKDKLDDPARRRRENFEASVQQARTDFALEMRKYTYGENASFSIHNFTSEVVDHLNSHAALFQHDDKFAKLWRLFIGHLEREASVVTIDPMRDDPDGFIEVQINRNLGFYFESRKLLAKAIIAYLSYNENYDVNVYKQLEETHKHYRNCGRVEFSDDSSLDAVLANRLPSKPET